MADKTGIEWTDATWNPIAGCSIVSKGCTNCYAMKQAARLEAMGQAKYAGLTKTVNGKPVWTGKIAVAGKGFDQPLRWTKPRRIFVNSMSDLFHESVADETIDRVFDVMRQCERHVFQILTKRPDRMRDYYFRKGTPDDPGQDWYQPNIWLGVSVEDQATADQRIPILLDTPAALRWISAEPLLGPLDVSQWLDHHKVAGTGNRWHLPLDWIVAGGESGPDARPMHPDWIRSVRDQCATRAVLFFFKQWGEWREAVPGDEFDTSKGRLNKPPAFIVAGNGTVHCFLNEQTGPDSRVMLCVGKHNAGATLDGREHREYPR